MQAVIIPLYSPESPTAALWPSAVKEARVNQKKQDPGLCDFGSGMFVTITPSVVSVETVSLSPTESPPASEILIAGTGKDIITSSVISIETVGLSFSEGLTPSEVRGADTDKVIPSWLEVSIERLNELRSLPANWDSYGAAPPNPIICDLVQSRLFDLCDLDLPDPFLAPVANGGIYLKLKIPPREIEIEFDDPSGRYASCLFVLTSPREDVREKPIHLATELRSAIFWLLGENQLRI